MKYVGVSSPAYTIVGKPKNLLKDSREINNSNKFNLPNIKYDFVEKKYPKWKFSKKSKKNEKKKYLENENIWYHCKNVTYSGKFINKNKFMSTSKRYNFVNEKNVNDFIRINKNDNNLKILNNKVNINNDSIKYSFGYKFDEFSNEMENYKKNIGPGKYNINYKNIDKNINSYKISTTKINKNKKLGTPGPGYYDVLNNNNYNSLNKKKQDHNPNSNGMFNYNNGIPGPGQYDIKYNIVEIKKDGLLFNSKRQNNDFDSNTPGPDKYNFQNLIGNRYSQKAVFGRASRIENIVKKPNKNKNKENYKDNNDKDNESQKNKKHMNAKGYKFSQSIRKEEFVNHNPGPGNYYNEIQNNMPKYSIRGRRKNVNKNSCLQSPGKYDPFYNSVYKDSKHFSFGKGKRFNESCNSNKKKLYDIRGDISKTNGIKFPKAKKNINTEDDNEIGPGYYELKSTIPSLQPWLCQEVDK